MNPYSFSRTVVLAICSVGLSPTMLQADLIITVTEDTMNNEITFAWNGIVGDAGVAQNISSTRSSDIFDPVAGSFRVADRSRSDVGSMWTFYAVYSGTNFRWGTGPGESAFNVMGLGVPFSVQFNGDLFVGSVLDGGTTAADVEADTIAGSFSISGSLASRGLFDEPANDIRSGPVTLWQANTGPAKIVFELAEPAVVPEPTHVFVFALGVVCIAQCLRRRRAIVASN